MSAMEIDEDSQSRQLAVYGREALLTLGTARVLISGLNGLGVEIGGLNSPLSPARAFALASWRTYGCSGANGCRSRRPLPLRSLTQSSPLLPARRLAAKNVSLAGVSAITLHDTVDATAMDLGAQVSARTCGPPRCRPAPLPRFA